MLTPLEQRLAALDAIPMREQFAHAYRAERARLHHREEAPELDRRAFNCTTYRATCAAVSAVCDRANGDRRRTTPAERLAARRERDSLMAFFAGSRRADP